MNDNNLFDDSIPVDKAPQHPLDPTNIDPNPLFTNLKILLTYFVFMILASIVSLAISSAQSSQTSDWINGELDYDVTTYGEDIRFNFYGDLTNESDQDIDVIYFYFDLLDEDGNIQETVEHRIRHLNVGETVSIDSIRNIDNMPNDVIIKFRIPTDPTLSNVVQVLVTFLAFVGLWFINKRDYINDYKKIKHSPKEFFGLVITGFILVYAANVMANVIMQLINATDTSLNESAIQNMFSSNALNLIALFLTLVILTPIVEETVFRKGLYGIIDHKFGDVAAILVSGFVFAFLHVAGWGDYINIIPYLFMGLSFSFIYYYSNKNIYVVIIIHMINNLIPFSIYLIDALS